MLFRSGDDTIEISSTDFTLADTLVGGSGDDILKIVDAATVIDEDFTNISGIEILELVDGASQTITLAQNASSSGLEIVDASALTNDITFDIGGVTSELSLTSGSGDDTILITSDKLDADLIVDGGTDTLGDNVIITDRANFDDDDISGFTNVETLTLSDFDSQFIELGAKASNTGLTTIDATSLTTDSDFTLDISELVADIHVKGGSGDDTVTISMDLTTNADTIALGDGYDTLIISDDLSDVASFETWLTTGAGEFFSGIESIKLSNFTNQELELGTKAEELGLTNIDLSDVQREVTVDASSLGGGLTITAESGNHTITTATGVFNDDITSGKGDNIIYLDAGNDTIVAGDGDDIIEISAANLTQDDTINGGDDDDILLIDTATTMLDSQFTNISYVETVQLKTSANQSITIGTEAKASGLEIIDGSVNGSGHSLEIDAGDFVSDLELIMGAGADSFIGGQGKDNVILGDGDDVIEYSNNYLNNYDEIDGGAGRDTLIINPTAGQVDITDNQFNEISSVEVLKLGENVAGQEITLGSKASSAGIETLDLSGIDGSNYTIDTTEFRGSLEIIKDTVGGSFTTSDKDDTITFETLALDATTTFHAGEGVDTIKLSDSATVLDTDFNNKTSVEQIELTAGGTVTLADKAKNAGMEYVNLTDSNANNNINLTGFENSVSVYLSGDGTDSWLDDINKDQATDVNDYVYATNDTLDANDNIHLGNGNSDTLIITGAANLSATELHDDLNGIEVLKLGDTGNHIVDLSGSAIANGISADATEFLVDGTSMKKEQTSNIDISGETDSIAVTMGSGSDTVAMNMADLELYSDDTEAINQKIINGGSGTDTLLINDAADITDAHFNDPNLILLGSLNLTSFEAIGLAAGGDVVLGKHAAAEGITIVDASNSTGDSTINMASVTKDVTVHLGANVDSVSTGQTDDLVTIDAVNLTSADSIALGLGEDTLQITTDVNYADTANFGGVLNTEILKLSGDGANQSIVMTGTSFIELDAKDMATGNITVDMTDQVTTTKVYLGRGDDTVQMTKQNLIDITEDINGGRGNDTIQITDSGGSYDDSVFASKKLSAFETIKADGTLTGGSNFYSTGIDRVEASGALTLDVSAVNRAFEVIGSSAADDFTLGSKADIVRGIEGNDKIAAGEGRDTFYFEGAQLDGSDDVDGGDDDDTIIFEGGVGIFDNAKLANVENIETIIFDDAASQDFTFGSNAATKTKVELLDASNVTSAFTLQKTVSDVIEFEGGSGVDTVIVEAADLTADDRLTGNDGDDILQLDGAATLVDEKLSNVKEFEILKTDDAINSLTLGSRFTSSGILTIDASAVTGSKTNLIDMSSISSKKAYDIIGGAGIDTIKLKNVIAQSGITIDGNGGVDILEIIDRATLETSSFSNISNVETLKLSDYTGNLVTLSAGGITTIDASSITDGNVTVDMSQMASNEDVIIDISNSTRANTIEIKTSDLTADDTIDGGSNDDIIELHDGGTLVDAAFAEITSFEELHLMSGGDYDITLGTNAATTGIDFIDATELETDTLTLDASAFGADIKVDSGDANDNIVTGTGNDTIYGNDGDDEITSGTGNDFLKGGDGNDSFTFTDAELTTGDKVYGERGDDSIVITDAATFTATDTGFKYVYYVETLELEGGGEATLNAAMANAGIREIDGSASTADLTIDASYASTSQSMTLTGGDGADKIFAGSGTDNLTGGSGADRFIFDHLEKENGTNTINDYVVATDTIALAFDSGTTDYAGATRNDGSTLSDTDFNNYVESWYTDQYDSNGDGSADADFTLITLTGGDTISLLGIDSATITQSDFVYHLVV